jgi:5-methylcytosine-specific restriction endonuclease McrA
MNSFRPKYRTVRLNPESYRKLCRSVLERDRWRCQFCGASHNLQVHHKEFRSHSGEDSEENLITLCSNCHSRFHGASGKCTFVATL